MPALSGLPALDVNVQNTETLPARMSALALLPDQQAAQQAQLEQQTALAPLETKSAQQKSDLQTMAVANDTLAQVAKDAQAADPEEAPSVWDEGMKAAAAKGVHQANQYIGHFRPDLAERVGDIYGGGAIAPRGTAANTNPAGLDPQMLDLQVAKLPPEQVAQSLGKMNRAIQSFNGVKDEASWNAEIQALRDGGLQVDKVLPNLDWNPMNYATAYRFIQNMMPYRDAMEREQTRQAAGVAMATLPNKVMTVGNRLFSIDPTGQTATPLASGGNMQYLGSDKTGGAPEVFDPATGATHPAGASGSLGTFSDFAKRMDQAENSGGDPTAKNPRSTATGNGQFIDATWLEQARNALPQITQGKSDAQVLALRNDPQISQQVTETYAQQNAQALLNAGMPVTTGTLALAHRFGPDGALKLLNSPADTQLSSIFPASVLKANPDMAGKTAGTYARGLVAQVGNDPVLTPTGDAASVPGNGRLSGDDYLKSIPDPSIAAQVKAIDEGRMQQPSSFFLKTPYGQMMMRAVAQYDPGFDLTLYNSRVAANTDLAKGKMGQSVASFNTALGHLGRLEDHIDALNNGNYPAINTAENFIANQTGDTNYQNAAKKFGVDVDAVASELTRAFRLSGGNESDVQSWRKSININDPPGALRSAAQEAAGLLASRIDAVGDQYNKAMRLRTQIDPENFLSPTARATLGRLTQPSQSGAGANQAPVAVQTPQEAMALKPGTVFRTPDGRVKVR